jgi:hypothetical protein
MRTQFFFVGLLSGVAGMLVGTAGCDNVTAGQSADTSAPPQLVHVLVQDARYLIRWPNRGSAIDLLDNNNTRSCTISCKGNCPGDANNPAPAQLDTCINEFLVDQLAPDVHCLDSGVCNDPFKLPATGIPIPLSADLLTGVDNMADPGGGIQVRLVFDKVLDNTVEMVKMDPTKAPGATNTYTFAPGVLELDDEAGMPVKSIVYMDNGGSPQFSADLELVPLGPAVIVKPTTYLDPDTTYTLKILKPDVFKDREGNAATGFGGGAIPPTFKFKTEDLTASAAGPFGIGPYDYPDFSAAATITPNEVIQVTFFGNIAGDTATLTVTKAPAGAKPIAYSERFNDATACPKAATGDPSGFTLDITNTDTGDINSGVPAEWPAGDYMLHISVKDINGKSPPVEEDLAFTVDPMGETTDPMADPNIQSQHVTPAQCQM